MVGDFKLNCTIRHGRMYGGGGGQISVQLKIFEKKQIRIEENEKINDIFMPRIKLFLNKLFFCPEFSRFCKAQT